MTQIAGIAGAVLYLSAVLLLVVNLAFAERLRTPVRWTWLGAATGALALHTLTLHGIVVTEQGFNVGLFAVASLIAWVMVGLWLVTVFVRPLDDLGIFVLPVAAFSTVMSLTWPTQRLVPISLDLGVQIHAAVSVLAYGVLGIGTCQALVLAYQDRRIRVRKPWGLLRRLPALQVQERLLFQLLGAGFFLLSMSLVSGVMFVEDLFAQHLTHKSVLSISAWLVFGILLWGRLKYGWRGRIAIRWCLAGFAILALAYFGSKLVLEMILGRHW